MKTILILSLFLLIACSEDDPVDKEEKGKGKIMSAECVSHQETRNACYRELMKEVPEAVDYLDNRNPFMLKTWDEADFSQSPFADKVAQCRDGC